MRRSCSSIRLAGMPSISRLVTITSARISDQKSIIPRRSTSRIGGKSFYNISIATRVRVVAVTHLARCFSKGIGWHRFRKPINDLALAVVVARCGLCVDELWKGLDADLDFKDLDFKTDCRVTGRRLLFTLGLLTFL